MVLSPRERAESTPVSVEKFQEEKYDLDAKGQRISRTST